MDRTTNDVDEINGVITRYCQYSDDERFADYADCFADDGAFFQGSLSLPKRDLAALAERFAAVRNEQPQPRGPKHLTVNTRIVPDADRAIAVSDVLMVDLDPETGWSISGNGRYMDEFTRTREGFRFAGRRVRWYRGLPRYPLEQAPSLASAIMAQLSGTDAGTDHEASSDAEVYPLKGPPNAPSGEGIDMTEADKIRNLIAAYCHAADDRRYEDYIAVFAPDGVLVEEGHTIPRSQMLKLMQTFWAARDADPQPNGLKHLTMNHLIDIDGDRASAVSDLLVLELLPETGWRISGNGRYSDQLVKIDGNWRIQRRTVSWYKDVPRAEGDPRFGERLNQVMGKVLADG